MSESRYSELLGRLGGRAIVVVCAWCPDVDAQTHAATAAGNAVSHTLCPTCAAKLHAELDAEESNAKV